MTREIPNTNDLAEKLSETVNHLYKLSNALSEPKTSETRSKRLRTLRIP